VAIYPSKPSTIIPLLNKAYNLLLFIAYIVNFDSALQQVILVDDDSVEGAVTIVKNVLKRSYLIDIVSGNQAVFIQKSLYE